LLLREKIVQLLIETKFSGVFPLHIMTPVDDSHSANSGKLMSASQFNLNSFTLNFLDAKKHEIRPDPIDVAINQHILTEINRI